MSDPLAHEVVPQAIVKEIAPAGLNVQATKLRADVIKEVDKGVWREGLVKIQEVTDVNFGNLSLITSKFGTEVDPATGSVVRNPAEQTLITRVNQAEILAKKFIEHGFSGLSTTEKGVLRRQVIEQARRIPALSAQITRLAAAGQQDNFADRYLQDPQFQAEFSANLVDILATEIDNNAISKFESLQTERIERDEKQAELTDAENTLTILKARLGRFAVDPITGAYLASADKGRDLERLRTGKIARDGNILTAQQDVTNESERVTQLKQLRDALATNPAASVTRLSGRISDVDTEIRRVNAAMVGLRNNDPDFISYTQERSSYTKEKVRLENLKQALEDQIATGKTAASVGTEITAAQTELTRLQGILNGHLAESQQQLDLEKEQNDLPEQVNSAEASVRTKTKDKRLADEKVNTSQREYDAAKQMHFNAETQFTEKFTGAFGKAAERMIAAQLNSANTAFAQELEDMKKTVKNKYEESIYTTMQNTWLGNERRRSKGLPGFRRTDTFRPFNKGRILADYGTLLREGDTALVRQIFERTENPNTPGLNYAAADIDEIFEKNPDFITKAKQEAIRQLLARKVLTGGMTHEDIYIVTTSEWGKGMINKGIEQNAEFRKAVGDVMGAEALGRHGFTERFGDEMSKHPFWWSLLLGIPAGVKAFNADPQMETLKNQI